MSSECFWVHYRLLLACCWHSLDSWLEDNHGSPWPFDDCSFRFGDHLCFVFLRPLESLCHPHILGLAEAFGRVISGRPRGGGVRRRRSWS
jgi:hypothetical protein